MAEGFADSARVLWNSRLDGPVRYIRALALKSGGATTIAACRNADAVLPCHSELFDAGVIGALGSLLKMIANHSVGTDHVDLAAARAAGIVVTNTPDVLSDATAEIACLHGGSPGHWETLWRTGDGARRPGGGRTGARLRDPDPLPQPAPPAIRSRKRGGP